MEEKGQRQQAARLLSPLLAHRLRRFPALWQAKKMTVWILIAEQSLYHPWKTVTSCGHALSPPDDHPVVRLADR
jgi:hypothetical protein